MTDQLPRGIRNNNPLNIRRGKGRFVGEVPLAKNNDRSFRQFVRMNYGIRAAFCVIRTYNRKYGISTLEGIIRRWAPSIENNTEKYIQNVVKLTGLQRDTPIVVGRPREDEKVAKLVWAMSVVECGHYLTLDTVRKELTLFHLTG